MAHRTRLVLLLLLLSPSLAWAQAAASWTAPTVTDETDTSTYTFSNVDIGAAASDRNIAVWFAGRRFGTTSGCTLSSATINGVAATISRQTPNTVSGSNCSMLALVYAPAAVTSGTTTTITATTGSVFHRMTISVLRLTGALAAAPASHVGSAANDPTGTLSVYLRGIGAGVVMSNQIAATTWTGLTESFDEEVSAAGAWHSGALLNPSTSQVSMTVTADLAANGDNVGIFATWGSLGPVATTPTHYVTSTGSGSSSCTLASPCTLTRAFALAGTAALAPGSYVSLAAGVYSQDAITTTGGGTSAYPIRFVGAGANTSTGTRLTGTRTQLPASVWTLTPSQTYTYQTPFDDAALYQVGLVAQRPPVDTWVTIQVDDRSAPFTTGSGRIFYFDEPMSYTERTSIATVEAQHCTWYHNTATNLLYVHPCREGAPSDADNYYAGPDGWGTLTYDGGGDWLTLEQVTMEHMQGTALMIEDDATDDQFLDLKLLNAQAWFKGRRTNVEDLVIKQNIQQGPVAAGCYSSQYGGGGLTSRGCWNSFATGYHLLVGVEETGFSYNQTFDRITLYAGWNAFSVDERNTINHLTCWGFANHCGQSSGTGVTFTNSIFGGSQDAWFEADEDWAAHTYTNNLFYGGILYYCGRSGVVGGATCPTLPTGWTFRRNIFGSLINDIYDEPTMDRDCNVWMPRTSGDQYLRIAQSDGSFHDYYSLAEIRAATANDDNSIEYPYTSWTNGAIFANYKTQSVIPPAMGPDFSLTAGGEAALTVCGAQAGPDTLAESDTPEPTGPRRFRWKSTAP